LCDDREPVEDMPDDSEEREWSELTPDDDNDEKSDEE
jgi:hypothetical protein